MIYTVPWNWLLYLIFSNFFFYNSRTRESVYEHWAPLWALNRVVKSWCTNMNLNLLCLMFVCVCVFCICKIIVQTYAWDHYVIIIFLIRFICTLNVCKQIEGRTKHKTMYALLYMHIKQYLFFVAVDFL